MQRSVFIFAVGALLAACANVNARFDAGQRALATGAWQQCIDELERFGADADCPSDSRCGPARVDVAECRLRQGDPAKAFFNLEVARKGEPPGSPLLARIDRLQKEAQDAFATSLKKAPGEGTLTVKFSSKVRDVFRFQGARFFLDLVPLPTDNQPYVPGTTVLPVPPTSVAAGTHQLEVTALYAGHGEGKYSYLKGYKFTARSAQEITVAAGAPIEVEVRAYDGDEEQLSDRLRIDFVVRTGASAQPTGPSP
jgi:hypothetical protein